MTLDENFKNIYFLYKNDVYRLAYSYTRNKIDAEDITQKTFIKLYKNFDKLDMDTIKNWILKVTSNECKNFLLTPWKSRVISLTNEKEKIILQNEYLELSESLKKIPKKYRIPIHLFYFYGYKIKEIAEILTLNQESVKTRLKRGKELLKKEMEKYENEKN